MNTPYVVIDLEVVETKYLELAAALPDVELCYAVKANPGAPVLELLAGLGASFDVASVPEIELILALGVGPGRISFGNTIKKRRDVEFAASCGIRRFTVDSDGDLDNVLDATGHAEISVRLFHDCVGADWPLSKKFGCGPTDATRLLVRAGDAGASTGISFHVGSQQRNLSSWHEPLRVCRNVFDEVASRSATPSFVNLGGGFPGSYLEPFPPIADYGTAIRRSLREIFGDAVPRLVAEPGRYLVADAGTLHTEVVLVSRRDIDSRRWVYLDCGVFGGLAETLGESIRYRLETDHEDGPCSEVVLAGPTCDSADIIYETAGYQLPDSLRSGDVLRIASTGAYTTTYSAVAFNGFAPLRQVHLHNGRSVDQLPKANPRSGAVSIGS